METKFNMSNKSQDTKTLEAIININNRHKSRLGDAILEGSFPKERLPLLAEQFYLQEKWPSHIANVYLALDEEGLADLELVNYIIAIMKAENLGVGSKGIPHSILASDFAVFTGITLDKLKSAIPIPQNKALMDWCDMSILDRTWLDALAVQLACESQVESMAKIAKGLRLHYGASKDDVQFWSIHGGSVEKKHMNNGLALLIKHTSNENKENVLYYYEMSFKLLVELYDSILGN